MKKMYKKCIFHICCFSQSGSLIGINNKLVFRMRVGISMKIGKISRKVIRIAFKEVL